MPSSPSRVSTSWLAWTSRFARGSARARRRARKPCLVLGAVGEVERAGKLGERQADGLGLDRRTAGSAGAPPSSQGAPQWVPQQGEPAMSQGASARGPVRRGFARRPPTAPPRSRPGVAPRRAASPTGAPTAPRTRCRQAAGDRHGDREPQRAVGTEHREQDTRAREPRQRHGRRHRNGASAAARSFRVAHAFAGRAAFRRTRSRRSRSSARRPACAPRRCRPRPCRSARAPAARRC